MYFVQSRWYKVGITALAELSLAHLAAALNSNPDVSKFPWVSVGFKTVFDFGFFDTSWLQIVCYFFMEIEPCDPTVMDP